MGWGVYGDSVDPNLHQPLLDPGVFLVLSGQQSCQQVQWLDTRSSESSAPIPPGLPNLSLSGPPFLPILATEGRRFFIPICD